MKTMTRRFLDEPWNKGDVNVLDELCGPTYTLFGGGVEDLKKAVLNAHETMRNFRAEMKELIAEGDTVAYGWTMRGTHAASGKDVEIEGITFLRFADGKIVDDRYQSSSPSVEEQIKG